MNRFAIPLIAFVTIVAFLAIGLRLNPREIPSPLINKPAPSFALPTLQSSQQQITEQDMKGEVWLFNVWASWCVACLQEHPLLMDIAQTRPVKLVGLNYKDTREDAINWLNEQGNPYRLIAFDRQGNVGIDYGVYGVPETFVVDKKGVIRLKHIGPLTHEDVHETLLPLVDRIEQERL